MILPGTGRGTAHEGRVGGGGSLRRPEVYAARKLRRSMSLPEALLWRELRGRKIGAKVRRQHPIDPYIVDFYVPAASLIIEVDGEAHDRGDRPKRDLVRDDYLHRSGDSVLRFRAVDVMQNLAGVLDLIAARVANPLHHPSDGPPPRAGEDH